MTSSPEELICLPMKFQYIDIDKCKNALELSVVFEGECQTVKARKSFRYLHVGIDQGLKTLDLCACQLQIALSASRAHRYAK